MCSMWMRFMSLSPTYVSSSWHRRSGETSTCDRPRISDGLQGGYARCNWYPPGQHDHLPNSGKGAQEEAARVLRELVKRFSIEAIAVGNGTAGRETEGFVRDLNLDIPIIMVDESGASVYSASEVARSEFPDKDVTVRGARPSDAVFRIHSPNWSRSTQKQSV